MSPPMVRVGVIDVPHGGTDVVPHPLGGVVPVAQQWYVVQIGLPGVLGADL